MDVTSYLLGKKSGGGGGGSGLDWSAIGYNSAPQSVTDGYNHAKTIYDNWDASQTILTDKFKEDYNLMYMPLVDTSNATLMNYMFYYCTNLTDVPLLNTSNCTNFFSMFNNCTNLRNVPVLDTSLASGALGFSSMFFKCEKLSNQSLDNILQMCIKATSYTGTKTLAKLGLTSTYYPSATIQALPHYEDFIDAGWTIGY